MKTNAHPLHFIYLSFHLCVLAGTSCQAIAKDHEMQVASRENDKVCLTGWQPLQQDINSNCLQIVSCFNEADSPNNNKDMLPGVAEGTCPQDLYQAMVADPGVTAMVNIQTGNQTRSEYISTPPSQGSSSWFYGWSAANFGMSLLHIFKAVQKAKLLYYGKTSNKGIYFFVSYMIGAFHHISEMPAFRVTHTITWIPHLMVHTGMLTLSIIERLRDCGCCSQFKNGHNMMIAFNVLLLTLATLW